MRETKPSAEAIQASKGRLRKLLFMVTSRANHGFVPLKENIQAHVAYLSYLEVTLKLFMAAPLLDEKPDSWAVDFGSTTSHRWKKQPFLRRTTR